MQVNDLCPPSVGAPNISLQLAAAPGVPIFAHQPCRVLVSLLSDAQTSGLMLPIDLSIMSPSGKQKKYTFARSVPTSFAFVPREGGTFMVTLKERHHMRWCGVLGVVVYGDPLL